MDDQPDGSVAVECPNCGWVLVVPLVFTGTGGIDPETGAAIVAVTIGDIPPHLCPGPPGGGEPVPVPVAA